MRPQRTACKYGGERGGGGGILQPEGEGGTPPEQARTPFVHGLIQEMGGNPKDLRRSPPDRDGADEAEEEG